MITKSGGNTFSGSFRANFSNTPGRSRRRARRTAAPSAPDKLNQRLRGHARRTDPARPAVVLLGRPLAGHEQRPRRCRDQPALRPRPRRTSASRSRAPGRIAQGHTVQANYIRDTDRADAARRSTPRSTRTSPSTRASRTGCSSRATTACCRSKLLANAAGLAEEVRLPRQRRLRHRHPCLAVLHAWRRRRRAGGLHYNGNYFDATDPEDRNNRQYAGSLSYFLTTPGAARTTSRAAWSTSRRTRPAATRRARPATCSTPTTCRGRAGRRSTRAAGSSRRSCPASRSSRTGSRRAAPTSTSRTLSFYLQDNWTLGPRLTLNLGVRHERVKSEATGGIVGVDTDTTVPRLAATYDLDRQRPDGRCRRPTHTTPASTTRRSSAPTRRSRNPALVALQLQRAGRGRAATSRRASTPRTTRSSSASFPTANIFLDARAVVADHPGVQRVGRARSSATRGMAKLTYVDRAYSQLHRGLHRQPDRRGRPTSSTTAPTSAPSTTSSTATATCRSANYQALLFAGELPAATRLSVDGHWTVQLKNDGNFEGEAQNQPGVSSAYRRLPGDSACRRANFPSAG